ncbi:hypothetical protein DLR60_00860 [Vibrio tarriae]|nr:hypothetical protein DLR60_00860 [Vibrio tarriae]
MKIKNNGSKNILQAMVISMIFKWLGIGVKVQSVAHSNCAAASILETLLRNSVQKQPYLFCMFFLKHT